MIKIIIKYFKRIPLEISEVKKLEIAKENFILSLYTAGIILMFLILS